ncbi:hypothetical protein [Deinococcus peraridilitoris]|uniref:Uncharacterized protein n=1 Tax=Deinococcus peraridilitoris (strain DSM 19664 / LMG 22246 / CIP 109416 / KR-200) TaxID=937777 RepID=K9ZYB2_DEIPD|nr:hypothetical protein [Deinococcus peraridilitoris]AFZ66174.1 hypothetical protein Deipe_0583 [Deinococcus peraridilitoris DSM 19664]
MRVRVSWVLYGLGFASIVVSAVNYFSGKPKLGGGQERTGLFIGQWPPTLFILGKIVEDWETRRAAATSAEGGEAEATPTTEEATPTATDA